MWFGGRRGIGDIIRLTGERGGLTTGTTIMVIITIGSPDIILITTAPTIIAMTTGTFIIIVRNAHIRWLLQGI
jgi:hypothetical protein